MFTPVTVANPGRLRSEPILSALIRKILREKYELVIIDPMFRLLDPTEDECSGVGIGGILRFRDRLVEEARVCVLMVMHDPKGSSGDRKITDRGSGSSFAGRDYDARITLTPHADGIDTHLVLAASSRYRPIRPEKTIVFDLETLTFSVDDTLDAAMETEATCRESKSQERRATMTVFDKACFERRFIEETAAIRRSPETPLLPLSLIIDFGRAAGRTDESIREVLVGAGLEKDKVMLLLACPRGTAYKGPRSPQERSFVARMARNGSMRVGDASNLLRALSPIQYPTSLDRQRELFLEKLHSDWRYQTSPDLAKGVSPDVCVNQVLPEDPASLANLRNNVLVFPEMDRDRCLAFCIGVIKKHALPVVAVVETTNRRFGRTSCEMVIRFKERDERIPGKQTPSRIVYEGPLTEEDVECYRAQYLQLIRLVASSFDVRDSISTMHYDPKSRIHLPGDFGEWHTELRWLDRIDPVTDSLF